MTNFRYSNADTEHRLNNSGACRVRAEDRDYYSWRAADDKIIAVAHHTLLLLVSTRKSGLVYQIGMNLKDRKPVASYEEGWQIAARLFELQYPEADMMFAQMDASCAYIYALHDFRFTDQLQLPPSPLVLPPTQVLPGTITERVKFAEQALRAGRHAEAIKYYNDIIQTTESKADFDAQFAVELDKMYANRGTAKKRSGDLHGAVTDYSHAIAYKNHPSCYRMRAETYDLLGDLQRAIADTQTSLLIDPESPIALYNLPCYQAKAGLKDEALANIKRLLQSCPEERINLVADEDLASLRNDPAFLRYLKDEK